MPGTPPRQPAPKPKHRKSAHSLPLSDLDIMGHQQAGQLVAQKSGGGLLAAHYIPRLAPALIAATMTSPEQGPIFLNLLAAGIAVNLKRR